MIRDESSESKAVVGIDLQRPQITVVEPDEARAGRQGRLEFTLVVDFDQRLETEFAGKLREMGKLLRRQDRRQQEDEIRSGGAQERQLAFIDDEVLGQDRDLDRGPDGAQIGHRATEPVGLAEHGDGAGAAGFVGTGEGNGEVNRGPRGG